MIPEFNKLYLLPLALVILIIGGYYWFGISSAGTNRSDQWQVFADDPDEVSSVENEPVAAVSHEPPEEEPQAPQTILIYITGEVENPNVYELPLNSRVKDAVDAAGGATENAALDAINLSLRISDEDHIMIPKIGEEATQTIISSVNSSNTNTSDSNAGSADTTTRLININSASSTELQTLTGIGPVMAGRIIDYREKNGAFRNISEIKNISGIGEKTFEAIADHITVN